MAAPSDPSAGKQPAQDIAETSAPRLLVLSNTRVTLNSLPHFAKVLLKRITLEFSGGEAIHFELDVKPKLWELSRPVDRVVSCHSRTPLAHRRGSDDVAARQLEQNRT